MSEKTLRQIGDEAAYNYAKYKEMYELNQTNIECFENDVEGYAEQARKEERRHEEALVSAGGVATLENADLLDAWVGRLARTAFGLEEAQEFADEVLGARIDMNAAHYKENQASYQETAIIEARLDGIEINV